MCRRFVSSQPNLDSMMMMSMKRVKGFIRLSLVLNVVIVTYLCLSTVSRHSTTNRRVRAAEHLRDIRPPLLPPSVLDRALDDHHVQPPHTESNTQCRKRVLLFGARQHWFEFCSFDEFSQYKYLISFPRVFECPEVRCSVLLSYSLEARDIPGNDIVVFTDVNQWITPLMWDWAHGNRSVGQRWVMVTEESPLYGIGLQPLEKYANMTYDFIDSYKTDSDFVHPYGYYTTFRHGPSEVFDPVALIKSKTKLVAWMGSHCETLQWSRLPFVEQMGKIVRVDKFGKCGDVDVAWNNYTALEVALKPYKFYLSLENSCCDDYVSEKFWRTLELGLVPIAVGAPYEFYRKVAPPNSFIHPDQFDSLEEMALHLVELNADDEKYLEYFKWKNLGKLVSIGQEEHYVRPLTNQTQCNILEKHMASAPSMATRLDYFGDDWYGSCRQCGTKPWMKKFMLAKHSARQNADIWA